MLTILTLVIIIGPWAEASFIHQNLPTTAVASSTKRVALVSAVSVFNEEVEH